MSIPREHRLRKHAEFELVYRNGNRHFSKLLTAFYLLRDNGQEKQALRGAVPKELPRGCRIGITVGRALGTSTARNRIKRRVRAAVRENLGRITGNVDVVINPKKAVLELEYRTLCSELARAFDAIQQKDVDRGSEQESDSKATGRDLKTLGGNARKI